MKKKIIAFAAAALLLLPLVTGCFGNALPEEPPVVAPGDEITLAGSTDEGEFKMAVSLKSYANKAALGEYTKKMSMGDTVVGGAFELSFRLD